MATDRIDNKLLKPAKSRIWELDFIRGICVLLMVWDHLMFDVAYLFGETWAATGDKGLIAFYDFSQGYFSGALRELFHPIIYTTFFVLCGISCSFSKNNLLRGIEALFFAFMISIVTTILDTAITFGVLHMLGFAILAWWVINTLCLHNKYATAIMSLIIGIAIVIIANTESIWTNAPQTPDLFFISEYFGRDNFGGSYGSQDYFPIFPNVGYMLIGAFVGPFLYPKRKSLLPMLDKFHWHEPVSFFGRIALWVYVLHQVVVMVVLCLLSYLFFTPGNFIFL